MESQGQRRKAFKLREQHEEGHKVVVSVLEREGAAVDRLGNGGLEPG